MQFPVTRYEFFKNQVIYISVFEGNAYCSFHNRGGLTDEKAKQVFHRAHNAEVLGLVMQKKQNENLINS